MISSVPEALRKSLGDEAAEALRWWIQETLKNNAVSRDEHRQILNRLDILEHDVSELRQEFKEFRTEVYQRFDLVNERFDRMNERFDERFDQMNKRFDERFYSVDERFDRIYERIGSMTKWTVGTLALFGTLITILLTIGQFLK